MEFKYAPMFQLGEDKTEYYLLTKDHVSVGEFEGKPMLKIEKEGLTAMANAAFRDVSFMLRPEHNAQVAKILSDPEASENDKYVALTFLRNAEVAAKGKLPFCQDTGTAIIHGEKGQYVYTGADDEEYLSHGVYDTYTTDNLRYSQNAPLNMYDEVNTGCNLPAQIDVHATNDDEYHFLFVAKGGGRVWGTVIGIVCQALDAPFLVIENVVVDTAYRNQGVGRKMFAALDEFAKEKGCGYAILVSSGFREGAHRFYEAMGYTEDVRGFRKYYSAE